MIVGLIVFALLLIVAGACGAGTRRRAHEAERQRAVAESRPPRGQYRIGRAALRAYRTVGDVRAMARGPGAYGRRVARRAVFRSLWRL